MARRAGRKGRSAKRPPTAARPPDADRLRRDMDALQDAVLKIQDYLLRTSERIDHILGTLKNHRELLVKMNQRLYQVGTRERIRMELDIMKNTLSVLALNGVGVDEALVADVHRLRDSTEKDDIDVGALRKAKETLDRKFLGEVKKFDMSGLFKPKDGDERGDVPGYG